MTHEQDREEAATQHALLTGSLWGQSHCNTVNDFIAGCRWEEHALAELSLDGADPDSRVAILQAALAGWLGVPIDTSMGELLTKLRSLRGQPWPPPGYGNTDALADIYNVEYKKALQQEVSVADAHQHACEVIHKLGWHDGKHIGAREKPFLADGPLPQGYIIHSELHYDDETNLHDERHRAQKEDGSWAGIWREGGQGGLLVADAWKHVTKAIDVNVDEAGGR